jgi:aminopeptidase N
MNFKHILLTTTIIGFAVACSTSKKTQSTKSVAVEEPSITLDTIKVSAEEPPKKKIYQATNTKLNDIIHTKLWVSFDWQKSQLNGKAEIEVKPYFYATNMLYLNARGMDIKSVQLFEKSSVGAKVSIKGKEYEQKNDLTERPNTYKYENDSLKINLGREYSSKETYYVIIEYVAKPNELKKGGSSAISDDKGFYKSYR